LCHYAKPQIQRSDLPKSYFRLRQWIAGFQDLLELLKNEQAWVKMTGPYRICDGDQPYADMRPFNDAAIKANPNRLVWGSDWPHVMVKKQMPHDADLCDLLGSWVDDEHLRKSILVDNPCILYDFAALHS
jgi:predicted TIM-barrel fold metal-dependent hydrolase